MKKLLLMSFIFALASCFIMAGQTRRDSTLTIKESLVTAIRKTKLPEAGNGEIEIPRTMVKNTPALLGEPDLVKTIQLLPGVKSGTEGLSGIYVRGGGPDENLLLLDGIPLCSSGHMLGVFSVFQDEAVDRAILHKGDFPARFGGRVSGIIDICTSDGDPDRINGRIGIGTLTDKFHLEGPVVKGRTAFSVSGRGMHTLLMDGAVLAFKLPANYYFDDLHAKVSHRIGPDHGISVSFFRGLDKLRYREDKERTDLGWGNNAESIRWTRNRDRGLSSDVILGRGSYRMGIKQKTDGFKPEGYRSGLEDLVAKAGFKTVSVPGNELSFGADMTRHVFSPGTDNGSMAGKSLIVKGFESAAYAEDRFGIGENLSFKAGLRAAIFSSGSHTTFSPEPRLSVTFNGSEPLKATVSYSRMSQYIHLLSPSLTTLPIDIWVPVTKKTGPEFSDLISAGIAMNPAPGWRINLEGYWKSMDNIIEYKDGIMFVDDFSTWEEQTATGKGRSYGLELLICKSSGKTTGWIGYTLSKSERRFPDGSVSSGEWFPCRYDCRNDVALVLNRRIGENWNAGLTWTYTDGGAMTVPDKDGNMPHRGNVRLPPSHRLDLGFRHHKARKHGEGIWNFGIYNAYNRKNPNIVFYVSDEENDGPGSLKIVSILPIIPSASYTRVF